MVLAEPVSAMLQRENRWPVCPYPSSNPSTAHPYLPCPKSLSCLDSEVQEALIWQLTTAFYCPRLENIIFTTTAFYMC